MSALEMVKDGAVPVKRARELLGNCSNGKFYQMVAEGKLPLCKLGRKSAVPLAAIHKLLVS